MSLNMRRNLPRVMIADDHVLVAEACRKLLEVGIRSRCHRK